MTKRHPTNPDFYVWVDGRWSTRKLERCAYCDHQFEIIGPHHGNEICESCTRRRARYAAIDEADDNTNGSK